MDQLISFVRALSLVYTIMIFAYIVMMLPIIPYSTVTARLREFLDQTVAPYLNLFRRFIPPLGMFDLSPIVALIVLNVATQVVVGILSGL